MVMKCDFCGKEVNSIYNTEQGKFCNNCRFLLRGESLNAQADYEFKTHDGISFWLKDNKIVSGAAWIDDGYTSVPTSKIPENPVLAIIMLREMIKNNNVFCSDCFKIIKNDSVFSRRFAGVFCETCAPNHKYTGHLD